MRREKAKSFYVVGQSSITAERLLSHGHRYLAHDNAPIIFKYAHDDNVVDVPATHPPTRPTHANLLLSHPKVFVEAQLTHHYSLDMQITLFFTCGKKRYNKYLLILLNIYFMIVILIELSNIDVLIFEVT